ncbi:hypothetical protein TKK_0013989 [Trichogramma kaykai]
MSRHRDVRSMNYSDEYDGYDDVYGHSVEDDYCVSPSAEQFMFDRSKQPNISSFFTEPDIQEDNEEIEDIPSSYKLPQLSDLDAAKLMSCIEAIKNVIGDTHPESELNKKIIEFNFNTEAVLNSILNEESSKKITNKPTTEKDIDNLRPGSKSDVDSIFKINDLVANVSKIQILDKSIPKTCDQIVKTATNAKLRSTFSSLADLTAHNLNISEEKKTKLPSNFSIPKLNFNKSLKPSSVHTSPSLSFRSLADSSAHHLSLSNSNQKNSASDFQFPSAPSFNSLADLTAHHLKISNSNIPLKNSFPPSDNTISTDNPIANIMSEVSVTLTSHEIEKKKNVLEHNHSKVLLPILENIKTLNLSNEVVNNVKIESESRNTNFKILDSTVISLKKESMFNLIKIDSTRSLKKQASKFDFTTSSKIVPKLASQVSQPTVKVIPAAAARSITKGFDVCGTNENIESLGTSRSQSPCSGRNSPDPLTRDDSSFSRREKKQTALSVLNKSTSSRSQSPAVIDEGRVAEDKRDALAIYRSKRAGCKEQLHLICVGHVDAGKSTLLGRLLCDLGQVSSKLMHKYQQESKKIGKQSFAYAWVLDETGEERERGITMDVGQSKFETSTKAITLLDAPGHKDFIPNMIIGATQADVALLVVDATRGEFETGFDSGGQTREHALLLRSLGVSQLAVVVNKLDTVNWSKERFNEIVNKISVFLKQAGFKETVTCVPCSGLSGENIVTKPKAEGLSNWYTGPTLVEVIDNFKCPERPVDKPLRFSVNDIFKNIGSGFSISGHMETGMVSVGDKVLVLPRNEPAVIKGIQADDANITHAFAGDQVCLSLSGIDQQNLAIGDIVCSLAYPVPTTTCFQAHIVVFQIKMPITNGMSVVLHQQSLVEPAVITKLVAQLNRSSGEVIKKKPRCLIRNTSAIVQITTQRPICVELHKDVKQLGRVMLRVDGTTIAAGLVTKIV